VRQKNLFLCSEQVYGVTSLCRECGEAATPPRPFADFGDASPTAALKIFGFAAYSGSGKTTLIENLVPLFVARG